MIVAKYKKLYPFSLLSHIDLLRVINKLIRRCNIKIEYSQGFNPHMLVFFSPPIYLGCDSNCEYVTFNSTIQPNQELLQTLNKYSPEGLIFTQLTKCNTNPNLANEVKWASYSVSSYNIGGINYDKIINSSSYEISYINKGVSERKDIRHQIHSIKVINNDNIEVIIASGNSNLRADRLCNCLIEINNCPKPMIIKQQMYVDDKLTTVDEFLAKINTEKQ